MTFTELSWKIFEQSIADYHKKDDVDTPIANPFEIKTIEYYLYLKNWIDTVQWHLEDIIRNPEIDPVEALKIKRRIDKSNQDRTDLVEQIDSHFLHLYSTGDELADVDAGHGNGEQPHRGEYGKTSTHIVGDDVSLVTFHIGELL